MPTSAASKGGIKAGDVIISIDEQHIQSFAALRAKIGTTAPGKTIKLGILRNGHVKIASIVLDASTSIINSAELPIPALQGISLKNGSLKDGTKGVIVENIPKNSPAFLIGLKKGDVIVGINREK